MNLEKEKILSFHSDWIASILILDSNDIISGSYNGEIIIFQNKTFSIKLKAKLENFCIRYLTKLKEKNRILISSLSNLIIIELNTNNTQLKIIHIIKTINGFVRNSIYLNNINNNNNINNSIVCCINDIIQMFQKLIINKKEIYQNMINLNKDNSKIDSLLQINNELITTSFYNINVRFWDLINFKNTYTINNIMCSCYQNAIQKINNNIIAIGNSCMNGNIYLINIITHKLIGNYKSENCFISFSCIKKFSNDIIICGEYINNKEIYIEIFKINNINDDDDSINIKSIGIQKVEHNKIISDIIITKNKKIITSSYDQNILIFTIK